MRDELISDAATLKSFQLLKVANKNATLSSLSLVKKSSMVQDLSRARQIASRTSRNVSVPVGENGRESIEALWEYFRLGR